jgi:hypothetical protein
MRTGCADLIPEVMVHDLELFLVVDSECCVSEGAVHEASAISPHFEDVHGRLSR